MKLKIEYLPIEKLKTYPNNAKIHTAEQIEQIKKSIEGIGDQSTEGEMTLSFVGKNGGVISKLYSYADEGTGSVLRNIIEDTLEEYNDLSVNDRVSILLEMIEKIIK